MFLSPKKSLSGDNGLKIKPVSIILAKNCPAPETGIYQLSQRTTQIGSFFVNYFI
jgi:hypothetical protein